MGEIAKLSLTHLEAFTDDKLISRESPGDSVTPVGFAVDIFKPTPGAQLEGQYPKLGHQLAQYSAATIALDHRIKGVRVINEPDDITASEAISLPDQKKW